jgi:hypothetical protein
MALGLSAAAEAFAANSANRGGRGPGLNGPYLDLGTGPGNKLALARIAGNLDERFPKYSGAMGVVAGVRDGEPLRDLFGFEVISVGRLWKQADGSYRVLHRETVLYTDLKSGDVLTEFANPYTQETVRVVDIKNDPWNEYIEDFKPRPPSYGGLNKVDPNAPRDPLILPWREVGGGLVSMQRHIHLYYPAALQPEKWPRESAGRMNRVSEFFTYCLSLADLQNPRLKTLHHSGTWVRVTPWLPWMLMGQAAGHIVYHSTMHSYDDIDGFKPKILAHMQKHHPEMLEPPPEESWSKPNLSSLEVYARDQNPAPPKP